MFLDKVVTQKGINAAKSLLNELKLNTRSEIEETLPIILAKSKWVRASKAGMYRSHAINGAQVKKGEILGTITDPFGQFEINIKAPCIGHLICINHAPMVNQGDAIFNIGIE